jgi:hypothetical protein
MRFCGGRGVNLDEAFAQMWRNIEERLDAARTGVRMAKCKRRWLSFRAPERFRGRGDRQSETAYDDINGLYMTGDCNKEFGKFCDELLAMAHERVLYEGRVIDGVEIGDLAACIMLAGGFTLARCKTMLSHKQFPPPLWFGDD